MVFANAAVPLAGVVDTAVIGAVGDKVDLGGVSLGATVMNILLFSFYFLRMASTGLAAQAGGRGDVPETQRVLGRTLLLGVGIGVAVLALWAPIRWLAFALLQGEDAVEATGATYLGWRALGLPGAYATFAITGWLIGLGRTRPVLAVHAAFSGVNIALDLLFVLGFGWGVAGVGAATAIGDVVGAVVGLVAVAGIVREQGGVRPETWADLRDAAALRRLFAINGDLMVRSWGLIVGFSWFTNSVARQGTALLAGSHVLLQLVTLTAFVLDSYAFVAETAVGEALGQGSIAKLRRAIRVTSELAVGSGLLFSAGLLLGGPALLEVVVSDPEARAVTLRFLPWCAAVPILGSVTWQLDGVFGGATRTGALRNASVAAAATYIGLDLLFTSRFGPIGTWSAFLLFYVARAGWLAVAYPALEAAVRDATQAPTG